MRLRQIYVASLRMDAWPTFQRWAYRLGLSYQYRLIDGRHIVWARPYRRPALRLVALLAQARTGVRRVGRRVGFWLRVGVR